MTPRTSIVVPSRGGAQRLPVLLAALAAQTDTDFEVVIVLDGDHDGSRAAIQRASQGTPVRIVEFPTNRGRSVALNAGFGAARGDVLVRCDDDLMPQPDYVARHAQHHDTATAASGAPVGVVGLYRNTFPWTAYARAYGEVWDKQLRRDAYAAHENLRWRYWAGNVSVSRSTWERVGPYDERFRGYGWEDVDWGYRLNQVGVPIVLDPFLETRHLVAATTCAGRAQRAFHSGAARTVFEAKHGRSLFTRRQAASPWDVATRCLSAWMVDEHSAVRIGGVLDKTIPRVPDGVARKLVALIVDASFAAGHRRPAMVGRAI